MANKRIAMAVAMIMTAALGGCQTTSKIDTGASVAPNSQADISIHKMELGETFFLAGNYGSAEKSYRAAVEATPGNGEAWLGLAASYDQLGRFDLADRAYEALIKLEGRRPAVLNNYAYSHILRGDMKKAKNLLIEARQAAPSNLIIDGNWKLANAG